MTPQLDLPYEILNETKLHNLFINCKNGDLKAREKLILHHLRLVVHIVNKFDCPQTEINDLINIGTIGLIKAIDSFKLEKNVKFTTYSVHCIQNEILMYFRQTKRKIYDTSIETIIGEDEKGNLLTLKDTIIDTKPTTEEIIFKNIENKLLRKLIDELAPKQQEIVKLYFGFDNVSHNQKELSEIYQVSQPYISKVINESVKKIKQKYLKYI